MKLLVSEVAPAPKVVGLIDEAELETTEGAIDPASDIVDVRVELLGLKSVLREGRIKSVIFL